MRIIEIASGDGDVVETAFKVLGGEQTDVTCLDISMPAIEILRRRFTAVNGLVADALHIPLVSSSFDVVCSQFGIEYAGVAAFSEAGRLVAPGGHMALLIHHRSGAIHRECSASVDAVARLNASEFIPRSITMFEAGFATGQGADRRPYDLAAQDLLPAYRELERIMQNHGAHVAGDTLLRLYNDVDRIHQHMERYDPAEIIRWLERLDGELDAYAGIMNAMRDSALAESQFLAVSNTLKHAGLNLQQALPLSCDDLELPLAWALIAYRPPQCDECNTQKRAAQ